MAQISAPAGPYAKTKWHRAAISVTTYPVTAQFTGQLFRAKGMGFAVESATAVVSFSTDQAGTGEFLVLSTAYINSWIYDDFHVAAVFIKVDTGSPVVCISAWA